MKKKNSKVPQKAKVPTSKQITFSDGQSIEIPFDKETGIGKIDWAMFQYRFNFEAGHSLAGLEAFITAFEENFYPPTWTIEWIFHAFKNYKAYLYNRVAQSNGRREKKTLDDFFGLSSKKRLSDAEKDLLADKNMKIFNGVSSLIALQVEPKRAFFLVSQMVTQNGLTHTPGNVGKIFHEVKKRCPEEFKRLKEFVSTWSEAEKKYFLSLYNLS